jgi:ferric-dicitrate binding protein FerR (iron transport regulator)
VPTGQRVKLTLPDGTLVWLNAQTKFTYPAVFCKRSRTVRLEGEGLFEVAADKSRPFTVQTGKYDVTATGTKFDVYAYNNSEAFETVMIEGSVEVSVRDTVAATKAKTKNKAFALKAGDKLWYDENMKSFKRAKVVPADYTSWIDGIYYFNDITFGEMSKRLEHYYKTEIIINDSILLNYRCTGRFLQNESITDIMDVVKADKAFRYTYDNENNTLTIKPKR